MSMQDVADRTLESLRTADQILTFTHHSLVGHGPMESPTAAERNAEPSLLNTLHNCAELAADLVSLATQLEAIVNDRRQQQDEVAAKETYTGSRTMTAVDRVTTVNG